MYATAAARPVNHYSVLGLSQKATQTEIKAAYYKLSKIYHPDVSTSDEDASNKFRQITAAYEVLGNSKLKKLYDRGLLPADGNVNPNMYDEGESPDNILHKRPQRHTRSQPATGRTSAYDFDEWTRNHYGDALNRRHSAKKRYYTAEENKEKTLQEDNSDRVVFGAILSCIILWMITSTTQSELDKPIKKTTKNDT